MIYVHYDQRLPCFLGLFLLFHSLLVEAEENTTCVGDCNGHGICQEGNCECDVLYEGEDCTEYWRNNDLWLAMIIFEICLEVILQSVIVVYAGYQLGITFLFSKKFKWAVWSSVTYILLMDATAGMSNMLTILLTYKLQCELYCFV